ncbi:hypothetical protein ACIA5A_19705 [Micromonospora sp. NPDC051300]|uniref:hypothetical protein n=1 Tax=Micromonospora sp. NPDC051300 TaxID=3364286 RepID=UPI00379DF5CC
MRRTLPIATALTLLCLSAGCGNGPTATSADAPSTGAAGVDASAGTQIPDAPASPATGDESPADPAAPSTTAAARPAAPPAPRAPKVPALTCAQLSGADLGSPTAPFYDHTDHIPLTDGVWNGEDGTGVELRKPCAVGDLDGDKAADAARAVLVRTGGTGQFWSVVFWRDTGGKPTYRAVVDLGDRTPVTSVAIAGQKATVVWLTRSADASMAELNVRRTTVYKLTGNTVTEVSHADAPYAP